MRGKINYTWNVENHGKKWKLRIDILEDNQSYFPIMRRRIKSQNQQWRKQECKLINWIKERIVFIGMEPPNFAAYLEQVSQLDL